MAKEKSTNGDVQGEGDYRSARRFNEASRHFVATHDVAKLARAVAPSSAAAAAELKSAEARGKARATGAKSIERTLPRKPKHGRRPSK
jgi:hypothetical protein